MDRVNAAVDSEYAKAGINEGAIAIICMVPTVSPTMFQP